MNFSASYFHSSFFLAGAGAGSFKSILINNFIEAWYICKNSVYLMFSSVSQSCPLFATPCTAAHQASLSITNCQNLLKLMSIKLVTPSNHFILCHLLLYLPLIFPSIRVFSMSQFFALGGQSIGVSASASVLSMSIHNWFLSGLTGFISLQFKGLSRVFSSTQFRSINSLVPSFLYSPTLTSIDDYWKNHI